MVANFRLGGVSFGPGLRTVFAPDAELDGVGAELSRSLSTKLHPDKEEGWS